MNEIDVGGADGIGCDADSGVIGSASDIALDGDGGNGGFAVGGFGFGNE